MPNPFFRFKKFTVYHDQCAMKVGTDGVLLGAWTKVENAKRILDIGTGTGLIALMLAQRSEAYIMGIDVDDSAVRQALGNVERSEWKDRMVIKKMDARMLSAEQCGTFDVIVSNPPFFTESVHSPDEQRNKARHMSSLPFNELLSAVNRVLAEEGRFFVVLPADSMSDFIAIAAGFHLYLQRQTFVHPKPESAPKRVLLEFGYSTVECESSHLVVELERHKYSSEYRKLTCEYYLCM